MFAETFVYLGIELILVYQCNSFDKFILQMMD